MNQQLIKTVAALHYEGDVEKAKAFINASTTILDAVSEVVQKKEAHLDIKECDYSSPSWAYQQAHYNGKREALREIVALLRVNP